MRKTSISYYHCNSSKRKEILELTNSMDVNGITHKNLQIDLQIFVMGENIDDSNKIHMLKQQILNGHVTVMTTFS